MHFVSPTKRKVWLASIATALFFTAASGQSVILQNYIQQGVKSNLQLQQEQLNYERSLQELQQARALFMPQLSANASYTLADGGRKILIPVGDLLNPVYSTLNQLTGSSRFPQIANVNEQFLPNDFHETKVRVIQPIFNPDIYFNYKAQKELITIKQAQRNTYENELKFAIASSYFQYLQTTEVLSILTKTKSILTELVNVNRSLVANSKVTRDVLLNSEYELSKTDQQLAEATKNNEVAQAYFNFLLNRSLQSPIDKDTLLATADVPDNLNQLTASATQQRQEISQLQGGLNANAQLISLNKNSAYLPKLTLVGDAGYQGFQYKFNTDQRFWLVQFGLSWDLFKGGEKKSKIQQARIDYQVLENKMEQLKKQIELQVMQAFYELKAAEQAYESTGANVSSTEKSFQITQSKYKEGQAILLEFLDAQNRMTTARLTRTISLYQLLTKQASLQKTIANL